MKNSSLRVLVACERSGVVREAFNAFAGVHAISCDVVPADDGRIDFHHRGDVRELLTPGMWDLVIAHPPCTRLCNSGVRWLHERDLWADLDAAASFFRLFLGCAPHVCIENPIPHGQALRRIGARYTQVVQPYQHGHGETKATCLWLHNLPPLQPSHVVEGRAPRVHHMSPGPERARERSRTYTGIAQAMAAQWVPYILAQ